MPTTEQRTLHLGDYLLTVSIQNGSLEAEVSMAKNPDESVVLYVDRALNVNEVHYPREER